MREQKSKNLVVALLAICTGQTIAQTTQPADSATSAATAATVAVAQDKYPRPPLPYGEEGINIPPPERKNGTRPRTVQLIGDAIGRLDGAMRVELIRDLGACQMTEALKYLQAAAADPDWRVRAEVARAAAEIGDKSILPIVQTLLTDKSLNVQREAILAGNKLGDPSFATTGLTSNDPQLLAAAMEASSTPEHADAIAAMLPNASLPLQIHAMNALGRLSATKHTAAVAGFSDKAVPLAVASMRSLGAMKASDQVQTIIATLAAAHPTVRRAAVDALATTAAANVQQEQAIRMLEDPDPTVRESATKLLQAVPLAAGVEPLVEQLDDGYAPLHHAAREALVAAKADAVPACVALLDHADPRRREDGSYVLGKLKSAEGLTRHIQLLEDPDWGVVGQAAISLGDIGRREETAPTLAKLIQRAPTIHAETTGREREQQKINEAAVQAMSNAVIAAGKLRMKEVLPPLVPMIPQREVHPYKLRAAITWAFGVMGDPNDSETCNRFIGMYHDLFEAGECKFEALKALGNVGYKPAAGSLLGISKQEFGPNLRWIAFWSHRVITGEPTEYDNPVIEWTADVSINDLTPS